MVSLDRIKRLNANLQRTTEYEAMKSPVARITPAITPQESITEPVSQKPTIGGVLKSIVTDPLGSIIKGTEKLDESIAKSNSFLARNIDAGTSQVSSNILNSLPGGYESETGPALAIKSNAERALPRGDDTITGKVVQAIPQIAGTAYTAIATGGKALPFLFTLGQSYGGAYGQARDAGVGHEQARNAALLQAIPEAAIEMSGGVENLIGRLGKSTGKGLLKEIGRAALEEGLEEVFQYPFEGLSKKLTYAPETPVASLKDQAIINPVHMGQNALVGGIAGGLFGGGVKVATDGVRLPRIFNEPTASVNQETIKSGTLSGQTIDPDIPRNTAQTQQQTLYAQQVEQQRAQQETAPTTEAGPIGGINEDLPPPENKVVMDSPKERMTFKQALKDFYTKTVDTQQPIVDLSKKTGDRTATLASNTRNVSGTIDYIFTDALVDRNGNKIGNSLKTVVESIPEGQEADFWTYMMQRHNIDRAREGKHVIPNYTPEMSAQAVQQFETAHPEYKAIGDNVVKWIDDFMKEWGVKSGLIDSGAYQGMRNMYQSYFPTQREFSQLERSMPDSTRRQYVDNIAPIRTATGSARDVNNPVENIMNLVNRTVRTARYNEVGQSLLESVRKEPAKLKPLVEIVNGPTNTDNVVSVLEKGKTVYLKINNKPLLDALKGLPKVVDNAKIMRKFTNALKSLITQKNPFFAIRNMMRDIPTAYVYGSESNPLIFGRDLVSAAGDVLTNSENYQRYRAIGGGMSNFFQGDAQKAAKKLTKTDIRDKFVDTLSETVGESGIGKVVVNGVDIVLHPLRSLEIVNNMIEAAPRLAEFNRTFERTGDVHKALDAANNVTVNFARGGNVTKSIEPYVPYLNAGVQGLDRFFKSFKNPRTAVSTLIKAGIAITLPEIAFYLINKDREEYKELDNRTKDNYFLIPKEDGTFIKIPKSRELGVIFGALFQRILRAAEGENAPFKGYGMSLSTSFAPANPIENHFLAPFIYNIPSNKDFAGRSIVPLGMVMDKRSPYLQYDERTSELAKTIGAISNEVVEGGVSPKQIDYLIDAYTGIIGDFVIPATTKGGNPLSAVERQFVADPLYSNQSLQNFYENYDMLQQKATDRNIVEGIPPKRVTGEEALRNKFKKASEQISALNKQIKQIETTLSPNKETEIRKLRQRILDIAKEANELLEP